MYVLYVLCFLFTRCNTNYFRKKIVHLYTLLDKIYLVEEHNNEKGKKVMKLLQMAQPAKKSKKKNKIHSINFSHYTIETYSITSVSYTHLDVYKRQ